MLLSWVIDVLAVISNLVVNPNDCLWLTNYLPHRGYEKFMLYFLNNILGIQSHRKIIFGYTCFVLWDLKSRRNVFELWYRLSIYIYLKNAIMRSYVVNEDGIGIHDFGDRNIITTWTMPYAHHHILRSFLFE